MIASSRRTQLEYRSLVSKSRAIYWIRRTVQWRQSTWLASWEDHAFITSPLTRGVIYFFICQHSSKQTSRLQSLYRRLYNVTFIIELTRYKTRHIIGNLVSALVLFRSFTRLLRKQAGGYIAIGNLCIHRNRESSMYKTRFGHALDTRVCKSGREGRLR